MGFLLSKLLPLLVYPLGLGLLLQLAGLGSGRKAKLSRALGYSGVAMVWLFAMPVTSRQLIWGLEERAAALTPQAIPNADAIVVLGGGLKPALPPRRGVEVGEGGDRLLTGVRLMRQKKAGTLVTSGAQISFTAADPAPAEAFSAKVLAEELGVPSQRILTNPLSKTTAEEARDIGQLAQEQGWRTVLLVTSAFHLTRSLATFEKRSGLTVIPIACDFLLPERQRLERPTPGSLVQDLLPDAGALYLSSVALKEHLGLALYRLKGWA
ncbi:MAG: YdcF family protein [Synechococcus sp. WH 8007]|nr:YdcF family protein [Synechococcus sp. WH 8007]